MKQKGKSRNVLASPLGEEGHEVAKGCTRVRMIMILDVDVTAERRHYNFIAAERQSATLGAKGPVKLKNPPAVRPVNPKNLSHLNLLNSMNFLVLTCHPAKIT